MRFFSLCADQKEAKQIYQKLAKCFHPDKGGDVELMKELNMQYKNWTSDRLGYEQSCFKFKYQPTNLFKEHQITDLQIKIARLEEQNWNLATDVDLYKKQLNAKEESIKQIYKFYVQAKIKLAKYEELNFWGLLKLWWQKK